tara:strand:- start:2181 stop:2468 length:288 start_codon:yes stop_codon:yes gene_type:complete
MVRITTLNIVLSKPYHKTIGLRNGNCNVNFIAKGIDTGYFMFPTLGAIPISWKSLVCAIKVSPTYQKIKGPSQCYSADIFGYKKRIIQGVHVLAI